MSYLQEYVQGPYLNVVSVIKGKITLDNYNIEKLEKHIEKEKKQRINRETEKREINEKCQI